MKLYIFNPDTDLALANGKGNYTPTDGVRQMISDLSLLPVWYAQPGSYVVADGKYGETFLEEMTQLFGLDVKLFSWADMTSLFKQAPASGQPVGPDSKTAMYVKMPVGPVEVQPWGWNTSFRNMLIRAGINSQYLPTDAQLEQRRHLSQRGVVRQVLRQFVAPANCCTSNNLTDGGIVGISRNVDTTDECAAFFHQYQSDGGVVFKEPWSSSGKGLLWCRESFNDRDKNWCQRVIDTQGYVTASPIYNKVQDFAMEFFVGDEPNHEVSFLGYSLFTTDQKGFYKGNALMSNAEIEKVLTQYVSKALLDETLAAIGSFLLKEGYKGCVGVDMMICQEPQGMCIHPCVEINYRHTMGYVARVITDRFLAEGVKGKFMIQHFRTHEQLTTFVDESKSNFPLNIKQGKFFSGFLPLVPITPHSLNIAYIVSS